MGLGVEDNFGSAELAAVCAMLGRISTVKEYMEIVAVKINPFADNLYCCLNFDQIANFEDEGRIIPIEEVFRIGDILSIPAGTLR